MGKSRLVAEWRSAAAGEIRWLESRCLSYRTSMPMAAFPELVAGLAPSGASATEVTAELDALLGQGGQPNRIRAFRHCLGVEGPTTVVLHDLAPVAIQFRTVEALASLLASVALMAPLVVAIDDVHWADDSSLRTIERLFPLAERTRSSSSSPFGTECCPSLRSGCWHAPSRSRIWTWRWCGWKR